MARRTRFKRSMLNGHPGNIARAVRRVIVRGTNHGLIVTSTTDGAHAPTSWHYIRPPRNFRGRAVDFGHARPGTPEARAAEVAFQRDLIETHGPGAFHELFGPDNALNVKNGVVVALGEGTPLETLHDTHVHVAPRTLLPLPRKARRRKDTAQPAKGIDVSKFQGAPNFATVRGAGYRFVWVKATEGQDFTDPAFWRNAKAARDAGLKVGAYHFLRPRAGRSGAVEARWFHEHLVLAHLGKGDLRPVLDVETTALGPTNTRRYVREALNELRRLTGIRPLFYTYPSFLEGEWPTDLAVIADLWIAHYQVAKPTLPKPWAQYVAWQFSSDGSVPGIAGRCDLNSTPDMRRLVA